MKTSTRWYRTPRIVLAMDAAAAAWLDAHCPLPSADGYEVAWAHTRNAKPPSAEDWQRFALDMAEHGYTIDPAQWYRAWSEMVGAMYPTDERMR